MNNKLCAPCEKILNTVALTKLWKDISYPLLCKECKPHYTGPLQPTSKRQLKHPPMRRCFLCGKRKFTHKFFLMKDDKRVPSCKKCSEIYETIRTPENNA